MDSLPTLTPFGPSRCSILSAHLDMCLQLLQSVQWLLDAYVVDFFTSDHWRAIPTGWREALEAMEPQDMAKWIDPRHDKGWRQPSKMERPMPLALLALRQDKIYSTIV